MDKELVKQKIRELSLKIKQSDEDWEAEGYEQSIATLIIDYSIYHGIKIPLIDYERYAALQNPPPEEERRPGPFKRKKIDWDDISDPEYNVMNDFFDAIGEHTLINPRFALHPEIQELVDCWSTDYDI